MCVRKETACVSRPKLPQGVLGTWNRHPEKEKFQEKHPPLIDLANVHRRIDKTFFGLEGKKKICRSCYLLRYARTLARDSQDQICACLHRGSEVITSRDTLRLVAVPPPRSSALAALKIVADPLKLSQLNPSLIDSFSQSRICNRQRSS